jgi:hypothetical protein
MGNGSVNTFLLLGSRYLIMQQSDYSNGNGVSAWSVQRSFLEDNGGDSVSSVWESVKRGLEPQAEE